MPTPFQLLRGVDAPPAASISLSAGPITAQFEPEIGFLRDVRYDGREIVCGIYGAVRDANWGTVTPHVSNLLVHQQDDAFTVRFKVECRAADIEFSWIGTITGDPAGIRYTMEGVAERAFPTNRTGLCVLHPIPEGTEADCVIERVDGSEDAGRFPDYVEPHQPFRNIRAIRQPIALGAISRILFEGDTFEMEDQRNWTDASFKTYSRPLDLPKPYPLAAGERVQQAVSVTFTGAVPTSGVNDDGILIRLSSEVVGPLPQIGLGVSSHGRLLTEREVQLLRALRPTHLRVDLRLSQPDWWTVLRRAASEAHALGTCLEVALFLTDDAEAQLAGLRTALNDIEAPIARWLVYHENERATPDHVLDRVRHTLQDLPVLAPIGGGTDNSFADLNRRPGFLAETDFVTFAINPQVHAFDDRTLVENLEGQAQAVRSARRIAAGRPVVVSPVTLRPRFNPEAVGPEPPPPLGELPFAVDLRQMSLFGAGWTVGSIHAVARAGASSVTFYETTGWRGVLETEAGSPLPEQFASFPGGVFPLYHPLADLAEPGTQLLATEASRPLESEALALRLPDGRTRTLIANHTGDAQTICLVGVPNASAHVRLLDLEHVERAMRHPEVYRAERHRHESTREGVLELKLDPYAVVTVEWESSDE